MRITYLHIKNFKSIQDLIINEVDNAMILVGKNNTGKTIVMDAIRVATGEYIIKKSDYLDTSKEIIIGIKVEFTKDDLEAFCSQGIVSKYKKYDSWERDFRLKLPSYNEGSIFFECVVNTEGIVKYRDTVKKNNPYIKKVFPKVYFIDHTRNINEIQDDIFSFYDKESLYDLQENLCIFDKCKKCNQCFHCIQLINKKSPEDLTIFETARLLEYKMFNMNLNTFSDKLNKYFRANGGASQEIKYVLDFNIEEIFKINTQVYNKDRNINGPIEMLSEGLKSIYTLSLLEAYIDEDNILASIIMIEDPEIYLHPQLQKVASEILFRLSKKNQIIFSTHSPNMIFNFSSKQIKQVVLDDEYYTVVKEDTDIDDILDDLGYTANDLMNVNFVFIVEGKQDSNRLPLLLEKYYAEIHDKDGKLQRISIIPTNSCTNIKTYANLKYMNKLYLKDQFLMIRDSDGKNPRYLVKQLCSYYAKRAKEDVDNIPKVEPRNVLITKYYSFENYFLDPIVMTKVGVLKNEDEFYHILYQKYKSYLYKLSSTKRLVKMHGMRINNKNDLKDNMELIKTYVRGHNLFDIFYGKYKGERETEVLKQYIEAAPREAFKDILDAIDGFVYFENRRK